jgi:hypothetical protein
MVNNCQIRSILEYLCIRDRGCCWDKYKTESSKKKTAGKRGGNRSKGGRAVRERRRWQMWPSCCSLRLWQMDYAPMVEQIHMMDLNKNLKAMYPSKVDLASPPHVTMVHW